MGVMDRYYVGREVIEEGALVPGKARRIQSLELVR